MDQVPENEKIIIDEGVMVGRLYVGKLVYNIRNHELFAETPVSYVHQGRLRECTCTCGQMRLIAERVLAAGRVQSCGCLKQERSAQAANRKQINTLTADMRKQLTAEIRSEQRRLKHFQAQIPKDEKKIEHIASRIRELMLQKLKTKNIKRAVQRRMLRKGETPDE